MRFTIFTDLQDMNVVEPMFTICAILVNSQCFEYQRF